MAPSFSVNWLYRPSKAYLLSCSNSVNYSTFRRRHSDYWDFLSRSFDSWLILLFCVYSDSSSCILRLLSTSSRNVTFSCSVLWLNRLLPSAASNSSILVCRPNNWGCCIFDSFWFWIFMLTDDIIWRWLTHQESIASWESWRDILL